MKNSTVMIAIGKDAPLNQLAKTLETLRAVPARALVLVIAEMPIFPNYSMGMAPYGMLDVSPAWQEEVTTLQTSLKSKVDTLETLLQEHGVSGEVSAISCEPAVLAEAIARRAMLCDMAWIGEDLRRHDNLFGQIVHGLLFRSPIGVMLNDPGAKAVNGPKRVFVAWTNHLHSARAVHQALPLLRQADEVIVATIDPVMTEYRDGEDPGVDVAQWLTHHGCNVVVQQYPSGGQTVGDCILARAKEVGADLIVMGSYSRSKTREAIFGGTTRTMIAQTDQAVFLSH